jgi:hypothetical protein
VGDLRRPAAYEQDEDRTAWHLGESAIDPQTLDFRGHEDDWGYGSVPIHRIADRAAARAALQGEGPGSPTPNLAWAQLADMRYGLMLGFIEHYLLTTESEDRALVCGWALEEMARLAQMPTGTTVV